MEALFSLVLEHAAKVPMALTLGWIGASFGLLGVVLGVAALCRRCRCCDR